MTAADFEATLKVLQASLNDINKKKSKSVQDTANEFGILTQISTLYINIQKAKEKDKTLQKDINALGEEFNEKLAEAQKIFEDNNKFLDDMAVKYNAINPFSKWMSEYKRLQVLIETGTKEQKAKAEADLTALKGQSASDAVTNFFKYSKLGTGASLDYSDTADLLHGVGVSTLAGAAGSIAMGGALIPVIGPALAAITAIAAGADLKLLPERVGVFNRQMQSTGDLLSARVGVTEYHQNMAAAGYALSLQEEEVTKVNDAMSKGMAINLADLNREAARGQGPLKVVRDNANAFGVNLEDMATQYTSLYNLNRRYYTSVDAGTRAQFDLASINMYGKSVAEKGYMNLGQFNNGVMATMEATSDYAMSAEEAAATMESITRIQGTMAVAPGKVAGQAQAIIGNMQNLGPELVMAMTGGGLESAYNWPNMNKRSQMGMINQFGGGLFSGLGGGPAEKMISVLARQQLMGMDARTARTAIEMPSLQEQNNSAINSTKDAIGRVGEAMADNKGGFYKLNQGINALKQSIDNCISGNMFKVNVVK